MYVKGDCDVFLTTNETKNATEPTTVNLTKEYLSGDVLNYSDINKSWNKIIESIDTENITLLKEIDTIEEKTFFGKISDTIG